MRPWSLHPKYLDAAGLVVLWREALLARAVLRGMTIGYRSHPQRWQLHRSIGVPEPHPMFTSASGPVASWEVVQSKPRGEKR